MLERLQVYKALHCGLADRIREYNSTGWIPQIKNPCISQLYRWYTLKHEGHNE